MDESAWYIRLIWICLLFVLPLVQGEDVCVQKTPCSCMFANGTGIDLSPSANNSAFISATYKYERQYSSWNGERVYLTTFYYHPCYDIWINKTEKYPVARNSYNTCEIPASLCRHITEWNKTASDTLKKMEDHYYFLGTSNNVEFAPDGSYIKYHYTPSWTIVHLVCAETDDQLDVKDLSGPRSIELQFFSRNACLRGNKVEKSGKNYMSLSGILKLSFVFCLIYVS